LGSNVGCFFVRESVKKEEQEKKDKNKKNWGKRKRLEGRSFRGY
jgi:hypothetical protein